MDYKAILAENIMEHAGQPNADKTELLKEISQMRSGDPEEKYFYDQLCSVFLDKRHKLVFPETDAFKNEALSEPTAKVNNIFYMDIAKFLIRNFEMRAFLDYDNKINSESIYKGLEKFPVTANLLSEIYKNMRTAP